MINSIIQTIIENKDFLEKSLEESVKASEISMFSRDLRKVFDEAGRKTLVGILETIDTILFESKKRKQEYETKDPAIARHEGHKQYVDVQYVVEGKEAIDIILKHFNLSRENLESSSAWWDTDKEGANFVYLFLFHIN